MSAIVTSPEDEDQYTNSRSWSIILDSTMRELAPAEQDEFVKHAGPIGLNFRFVNEPQRSQVAGWLLRSVEALSGPEAVQHGWDGTPTGRIFRSWPSCSGRSRRRRK